LPSDPAHRAEATEQYRILMKGQPQSETRYKFARLLAGDRAQVDEALEQYRGLVKAEAPRTAQDAGRYRVLLKTKAQSKEQYEEWRTGYRKALLWDEKNTKEAISEYRRYAAENTRDLRI